VVKKIASVKFQKDSEEWLMFQDFYRLCQKFWLPEDAKLNKSYWEELMVESGEFAEKYSSSSFAKRLALALLGYLGEKSGENGS